MLTKRNIILSPSFSLVFSNNLHTSSKQAFVGSVPLAALYPREVPIATVRLGTYFVRVLGIAVSIQRSDAPLLSSRPHLVTSFLFAFCLFPPLSRAKSIISPPPFFSQLLPPLLQLCNLYFLLFSSSFLSSPCHYSFGPPCSLPLFPTSDKSCLAATRKLPTGRSTFRP